MLSGLRTPDQTSVVSKSRLGNTQAAKLRVIYCYSCHHSNSLCSMCDLLSLQPAHFKTMYKSMTSQVHVPGIFDAQLFWLSSKPWCDNIQLNISYSGCITSSSHIASFMSSSGQKFTPRGCQNYYSTSDDSKLAYMLVRDSARLPGKGYHQVHLVLSHDVNLL